MLNTQGSLWLQAELVELRQRIGAHKVMERGFKHERSYRISTPVIVTPEHEEDVVQIMIWANKHRLTVVPQGGGTKDAMGEPNDSIVLLSMERLSGIVDYSPRDLTITVKAGTTIEQLQSCLAEYGQVLPLDMPHAEKSTVGGVFSANVSGPRRAMYGSARDYLMAGRVVYPDGRVIRIGAKVVKNVAGYDMNKLFIGAMGTLGVLTELTIKTRPIPFSSGLLLIHAKPDQLQALQHQLLDSQLEPSICEWLYGDYESPIGIINELPAIAVGFDDVRSAVHDQLEEVKRLCAEMGIQELKHEADSEETRAIYTNISNIVPNSQELQEDDHVVCMKLMCSISDVSKVFEYIQAKAEETGIHFQFSGGLYTGMSRVIFNTSWKQQAGMIDLIQKLQQFAASLHGHSLVECAPLAIRRKVAVWGPAMPTDDLMKRVKLTFDPHYLLNAGRFRGGI